MPTCPVCGDMLVPEVKVCALCGTNLTDSFTEQLAVSQTDLWLDGVMSWELMEESAPLATEPAPAFPLGMSPTLPEALPAVPLARAGRCLVLYGSDKTPLQTFSLRKDVTLIGRRDALRGNFPDIDVSTWLDEATARAVSRKHALLLHTRADDSYSLRPLAGNTGTQIEKDMVEPLKDYPLQPGTRLILGGSVRLKFETL